MEVTGHLLSLTNKSSFILGPWRVGRHDSVMWLILKLCMGLLLDIWSNVWQLRFAFECPLFFAIPPQNSASRVTGPYERTVRCASLFVYSYVRATTELVFSWQYVMGCCTWTCRMFRFQCKETPLSAGKFCICTYLIWCKGVQKREIRQAFKHTFCWPHHRVLPLVGGWYWYSIAGLGNTIWSILALQFSQLTYYRGTVPLWTGTVCLQS